MRIIQYLCEFFFTNFWHFSGLVIVLICLCPWNAIHININPKKD